jgi:hypothetical protein
MSELIAERMGPDTPIERSIFDTDDPERIWEQVLEVCPEAVDCFAGDAARGVRRRLSPWELAERDPRAVGRAVTQGEDEVAARSAPRLVGRG